MSNTPQSSLDGNLLPPRHRPTLGNLSQDTTELDLWAFDGEDLEPEIRRADEVRIGNKSVESPQSRPHPLAPQPLGQEPLPRSAPALDRIRMNISRPRGTNQSPGQPKTAAQAESDFDDLEQWEDGAEIFSEAPSEIAIEPVKEQEIVVPPEVVDLPQSVEVSPVGKEDRLEEHSRAVEVPAVEAKPLSLKPKLNLSGLERLGLGVFGVLLVSGMVWLGMVSIFRLPSEAHKVRSNDFPISGGLMTVNTAETYWRAPTTGVDAVRRGTQLIPVLDVKIGEGHGVLRVVFVDSEGRTVGDSFTRKIEGGESLKFSGTAGFEDIGMHAGYRTGDSPPWVVRVFEASSENAQGQEFKLLFDLNISPERR